MRNRRCEDWSTPTNGTDGRALLQGATLRGTTQSTIAIQRGARGTFREEAVREGALTAEKRPVRKTNRVATNNDAVCSPEGIRTPDLFLERKLRERSDPGAHD